MAPGNNHVTAISTEIFKYVRIHPNFASRPVWCEKMFLCCFSLKAGRKDLTNRPKVLSSHPPSPPHPTVFCHVAQGFSYLVYPNSAFFRRKGAIGGGGGGRENFRPVSTEAHHFQICTESHPHGIFDCSLEFHIVEIEVTGPGDKGQQFAVQTTRTNPANTGVVTGRATYASFLSSTIGNVVTTHNHLAVSWTSLCKITMKLLHRTKPVWCALLISLACISIHHLSGCFAQIW